MTAPAPTVTVTVTSTPSVTWTSDLLQDSYDKLVHDKTCAAVDPTSIEWALNCSSTR